MVKGGFEVLMRFKIGNGPPPLFPPQHTHITATHSLSLCVSLFLPVSSSRLSLSLCRSVRHSSLFLSLSLSLPVPLSPCLSLSLCPLSKILSLSLLYILFGCALLLNSRIPTLFLFISLLSSSLSPSFCKMFLPLFFFCKHDQICLYILL